MLVQNKLTHRNTQKCETKELENTLLFGSETKLPPAEDEDLTVLPGPVFASTQMWNKQIKQTIKLVTTRIHKSTGFLKLGVLTGLRVLCSLKLSSRKADWSLESLSFFRVDPFSSSSLALEHALSVSISKSLLLRPLFLTQKSIWNDETVLFGEDSAAPSSASSVVTAGNRFTFNPDLPGSSEEPGSETTVTSKYR
jgi:hypothetical protein